MPLRPLLFALGAAIFSRALIAQPGPAPAWCAKIPRAQNASFPRVRTTQPWFDVYRVEPDVYAIAEPRQWQEVISYLVIGRERALLFDTGLGVGDIKTVVDSLTRLPVVVVNSHSHFDHVGGNHAFGDVRSLDLPYTRHNALGGPHADVAAEVRPDVVCGAWPARFDTATYHTEPWRIARTLHDGSTIALGGRTLEVLHVPGHAPDAIALVDRGNGLLFTGDTFYEGPIYVFAPGADFSAYTRSVERLAALRPAPRVLLTAHNVAASSPRFLPALRDAVRAIQGGRVRSTRDGDVQSFAFDGFSVLLPASWHRSPASPNEDEQSSPPRKRGSTGAVVAR